MEASAQVTAVNAVAVGGFDGGPTVTTLQPLDLDHDGREEFCAMDGVGNRSALWRSGSDGWWPQPLGPFRYAVTTCVALDVDGDGVDELIVTDSIDTEVLNAADLSLVAIVPIDLSGTPVDVDLDGDLDLLDGDTWFEHRGTSFLATPLPVPFAVQGWSVADIDLDGDPDVAVGGTTGTAWLENDGTGFGWTVVNLAAQNANEVQLRDVDGDSLPDLFFRDNRTLSYARGDALAASRFRAPVALPIPAQDLSSFDVTADPMPMIVLNGNTGPTVWGLSPVVALPFPLLGLGGRPRWFDADGDGVPELVTCNLARISAWSGFPAAVGTDLATAAYDDADLHPADVDMDGDLDVVVMSNGDIWWAENTNGLGGRFATHVIAYRPDHATGNDGAVLDADLDGDPDLAVTDGAGRQTLLYRNDGPGPWTPSVLSSEYGGVVAGDLDGDADDDVVISTQNDELLLLRNQAGASFAASTLFATSTSVGATALADVDGDGDQDVLAQDADLIWLDNRTGAGTVWTRTYVADAGRAYLARDFDLDGDIDLAGIGSTGGYHQMWEATAPFGQAFATYTLSTNRAKGLAAADVDLDGDDDLMSASDQVQVRFMENRWPVSAGPTFPSTVALSLDASAITSLDLDADGDLDFVTNAIDTGELWVLRGRTFDPADDLDFDGLPAATDVCPDVHDPDQRDADGDGAGDPCDCAVDDPTISGGGPEVPYDGLDNDCDPLTADDDLDGDGAPLATDCDDTAAAVAPGLPEVTYDGLDNDCDATTPDDDLDGDGSVAATDCDDTSAAVAPTLPEVAYDGLDNDCDATTPDDDLDGDGKPVASDCDDTNPLVAPTLPEVAYDGLDNDCDAATPDDDLDGDGKPLAVDCDDDNAFVSPGIAEIPYDGLDNDCDPASPDDDLDGDGVLAAADCDDTDATIVPGASEVPYDGLDNDCDGATPDDDLDGDGAVAAADCDDEDATVIECPGTTTPTTDEPTTPNPDDGDGTKAQGCACDAGATSGPLWLAGLLAWGLRRARRPSA